MKKLTIMLLAGALCASMVLSGCQSKNGENQDEVINENEVIENNETESENTPLETVSPEVSSSLIPAEYNNVVLDVEKLEELLSLIQPKQENDEIILMHVNGIPVSATAVRYAVLACNEFYAAEENPEEAIEKEIREFHLLNAAVATVAKEKNAGITGSEFKSDIAASIDEFKGNYGDSYDTIFEEVLHQTPYYFFLNQCYNLMYSNLYESMTQDEAFLESAREEALKLMAENDYVRAKHILIQFPEGEGEDGSLTDAQKTAVLAKANDVLAKVKAMKSIDEFDELVKEYNEDPGMQSYPGGYYFTKGEMVPEFENSAYSLAEGETSGLVETTYGYHILLKLPLDDDAMYDTEIFADAAYETLRSQLLEVSADYKIEYAEGYEEAVAAYEAEYAANAAAAN